MKNYTEILEVLKSNFKTINHFLDEDYIEYDEEEDDDYELDEINNNVKAHTNVKSLLGNWKEIFVSGGSDKGSDWIRVYHFVDHDVYMKLSAYYSSYDGVEFNNNTWDSKEVKEVRPKEVIKVIYE